VMSETAKPCFVSQQLIDRAKRVWSAVLHAAANEKLLVITDDGAAALGAAFYKGARELGLQVVHVIIPPCLDGASDVAVLGELVFRKCDVYVAITSAGTRSVTHSRARQEASRAGARGLTLPSMTEEMLLRDSVGADYEVIGHGTEALANALNGTDRLRITSEGGTDLMLDVHGGTWFAERGLCDRPGDFSNLPGGEVSIAPVDAEGTLVVDGSINCLGRLESPLEITIKNRRVVSIKGKNSEKLTSFLEGFGPDAFNIAEIGIGMNPMAQLCGTVLEDEKILGTIHIGIGDNSHMGGKSLGEVVAADVHIDGVVISNPKICADGSVIEPRDFIDS